MSDGLRVYVNENMVITDNQHIIDSTVNETEMDILQSLL